MKKGGKLVAKTAVTKCTIPVSELLSLRLYSDTRPHCYRTSDIQKGLVFVYRGAELIGEGTGFGLPVARYQDKTYFPGSAIVKIAQTDECPTVIKQFALNMIRELKFRKARLESKITRKLLRHVGALYEEHRHWRPIVQRNLLGHFRVQTSFARVKPAGNVSIAYRVEAPLIHVKADFNLLKKSGLQKIFVLNEQSSKCFTKYCDSNGTVLLHKHIGAWDNVEANWAYLSNESGDVGFRLWKVKDTILRRGTEFQEGVLDWVGLNYEIDPEKTSFEYDIEILGGTIQK